MHNNTHNNAKLVAIIFIILANLSTALSTIEAGEIDVRSDSSSSRNSFSKIVKSEFTVDTGLKSGYFTYQIGGLVSSGNEVYFLHFPLSELRFPLNAYMLNGSYLMQLSNRWRVKFDLGINYSSAPGKMEDSDWGVASTLVEGAIDDPNSLDIFSRSRSELSLKEYSLHIDKSNGKYLDPFGFSSWNTYIGFGLSIQDYDFDIYEGVQEYPSLGLEPDVITGKGLIYNFFQITPYFSALFETPKKKQLQISAYLSLSPFVHISDFDNHILRSKISDGSTDGWSTKAEFQANWRLTPTADLFIIMSSQYTKANGWQTQTQTIDEFGSTAVAKVKLKHFSLQNNIRIGGKIWLK